MAEMAAHGRVPSDLKAGFGSRGIRAVRWPKLRRGDDAVKGDTVEEAPAAKTAAMQVEGEVAAVTTELVESEHSDQPARAIRRIGWSRAFAYGVLPGLALLLTAAAGFVKYQVESAREAEVIRAESVRTAVDGTIALLSYRPETVQNELEAAKGRLTGTFVDAYASLIHDVVIPGAQQKKISAVASVPAVASVSTSSDRAVVLVFVNQTVDVGQDPPTNTASSVRVTLERVDGRWLISQFDPV
jgi:Mce-associated membrane protein